MLQDQSTRKTDSSKREQAVTMLKHRSAALMIFHDAETPRCSTVHFFDAETPLCGTVHFFDAETPLCSTVHFSDAETPLKNTGDSFPDAETPLFGTFHFFPVTETSHPPIILTPETTPSSTCFAFSPFLCCNTIRSNLSFSPVAETPIDSNFSPVPPMLKHHCSAFFIPFPSSFSPSIIDETIPSSNCFASLLLKHHLPATVHHSSMMLKHHRSAPSDFLPILKHQLSAVLHL
jgi:hypothetical protein